jgi:hypothetical protein
MPVGAFNKPCGQFIFCGQSGLGNRIPDPPAALGNLQIGFARYPHGIILRPVSAETDVRMAIYKAGEQYLRPGNFFYFDAGILFPQGIKIANSQYQPILYQYTAPFGMMCNCSSFSAPFWGMPVKGSIWVNGPVSFFIYNSFSPHSDGFKTHRYVQNVFQIPPWGGVRLELCAKAGRGLAV